MNPITWLNTFLPDLQNTIEDINSHRKVIDSSMITKYLDQHDSSKNYLAIGVVPDINPKGSDVDNYKPVLVNQLMILKKTSYSEVNYDEFFQIFEDAYDIAILVLKKMLSDSSSGCNNLRFLNIPSLKIIPVWNLNSCNGCNILFSFDSEI